MNLSLKHARKLGIIAPTAPRKRGMNKLEAAYANLLKQRCDFDNVAWFGWETIKFRLADDTWFIPDFAVLLNNGNLEFHETKGFMRERAHVKIKIAAEMYPWRFVIVRRIEGDWDYEEVKGKRT